MSQKHKATTLLLAQQTKVLLSTKAWKGLTLNTQYVISSITYILLIDCLYSNSFCVVVVTNLGWESYQRRQRSWAKPCSTGSALRRGRWWHQWSNRKRGSPSLPWSPERSSWPPLMLLVSSHFHLPNRDYRPVNFAILFRNIAQQNVWKELFTMMLHLHVDCKYRH